MATKKKAAEKSASKSSPTTSAASSHPNPPAAPQASSPGPMHRIVAMQVENIKRIGFVRIKPKGNVVQISGDNGSGKTSLLDSIAWALTGERQLPSQPIRKGLNSARIQVDIGSGLTVQRTFTRVNGGKEPFLTRLQVFGSNKEAYPSPQAVLDKLRSVISFDPLAFIEMKPEKQVETLRRLVTFDVDLDALEAQKKEVYDQRREAGREEESAKARLKALPAPPPDLPAKALDTSKISKQLGEASTANTARLELVQKKDELERSARRIVEMAEALKAQAKEMRERAEESEHKADDAMRQAHEDTETAAAIEVPAEIDTNALLAELTKANKTNVDIQKAAQFRAVEKEGADALAKWTELDSRHKKLEADREAAIERAKMPIEQLSIGEGEVLYDGLPFSQASNGEQIRIAVALSMASNPQLRILLIRDGSLLDRKTEGVIERMAEENNFQVWIERVGAGKVGIVMEDGEATGDEVEQVARA